MAHASLNMLSQDHLHLLLALRLCPSISLPILLYAPFQPRRKFGQWPGPSNLGNPRVLMAYNRVSLKKTWDIVWPKVMDVILQIFQSGRMPPRWNRSLLCLIPKIPNPEKFHQFRPNSLCNSVYKFITKLWVRRLRPLLEDIVSPYQARFLPGRKRHWPCHYCPGSGSSP